MYINIRQHHSPDHILRPVVVVQPQEFLVDHRVVCQPCVVEDAHVRQHPANGAGQILQTAAVRLQHLQPRQIDDAIRYERDPVVVHQQLVQMLAAGQLGGQSIQVVLADVQRLEQRNLADVCNRRKSGRLNPISSPSQPHLPAGSSVI